ncbi:MAG TPA: hypothetical protein VEF33_15105 [Syntrophales bacterium]|nr:hypothetical protein [Syntrophales bacterium]
MKPVSIEVISNLLITYSHCSRCEAIFSESGLGKEAKKEDIEDYPPELKDELFKLSSLIGELRSLYKHRIRISMIDVKSPIGIFKSLLYRFRKYPTFIIEKKDVYSGWDREKVEGLLDKYLKQPALKKQAGIRSLK